MSELIHKTEQFILQEKEDLKTSAAYIKTKENKEAFLKKANYKLSFLERLKNEVMEAEKLKEQEAETMGSEELPIISADTKEKKEVQSIRSIMFWKGKEEARAQSISRAMNKWDDLY